MKVTKGYAIGSEIMDATVEILLAAGAKLVIDGLEVGENVYLAGNTSGIPLNRDKQSGASSYF